MQHTIYGAWSTETSITFTSYFVLMLVYCAWSTENHFMRHNVTELVVMHRLSVKYWKLAYQQHVYNISNRYFISRFFGRSLMIFNYLAIFYLWNQEKLAEIEECITILDELCRNWVKFKHRIGYQYWQLFELKYQIINKICYRCITMN